MIDDILKLLKIYDFEKAFKIIIDCLSKAGKRDYYFIVTGLIKIDILERDFNFTRSLEYLNKLTSNTYEFSLGYFKKLVNESLEKVNEKITEIYLEILEGIKRLDIDINKKYDLYLYIDSVQKEISKKTPNEENSIIIERKIVRNKYEELLNDEGMILLKPVSSAKEKKIKEVCESYVDIDAFDIIDKDGNIRIVLRYKNPFYAKLDYKALINEAKKYHNKKDFIRSINIYKKMLQTGKPNYFIYKALGIEYLSIGEYLKAIDYFTVAEALAYKNGKEHKCEKYHAIALSKLREEKSSKLKLKKTISEICKREEITYEELIEGLHFARIKEDRNTLIQISIYDIRTFRKLVKIAKTAINFKKNNIAYVPYIMQTKTNESYSSYTDNMYPLKDLVRRLKDADRTTKQEKDESFLDYKPFLNIRSSDLSYDTDTDYFGIDNFDEIDSYINETSIDVETAVLNFGLSNEQLNIVRLIYAREYYMQGYLEKGDSFVKTVEQDKHKNNYILEIMKKIKSGKRFYQNRQSDENVRVLSLTLKPKK